MINIKKEWENPKDISPQEFETNDGTWGIKICDEGFFELWHKDPKLSADEVFGFCDDELEIITSLLIAARQINPYQFETIQKTIQKTIEKAEDEDDSFNF